MITRFPALPLRQADRISKMMEDLFREPDELRKGWFPNVDVKETDKEVVFKMDVPGVKDEDIIVELVNDMLTIRGTRDLEQEERRDDYLRIERESGMFQRSFTLSFPAKPEKIVAECQHGVLKVTVPKEQAAHTHRIKVLANGNG